VVGFTKIGIDYSSPAVKGRKIFGEIEKFGTPWRAGANGQSIIEFSTPVRISAKNLRVGKYSIFMTPMATGDWTIHLISKAASIFSYMKDGKIEEEALAKDLAVSFKEESADLIKEIVAYLKSNPTMKTYPVSHTDNTGTAEHNLTLSTARANAVVNELSKNHGTPTSQVTAEGVGLFSPVATNATEEGKSKNRRVVMVLQK